MKERVVVYEKDGETLAFLQSFFKQRRGFQAEFVDGAASFDKAFGKDDASPLCIISVEELDNIPLPKRVSVIATISRNISDGIVSARKHGVDNYLLAPLYEEDLEFKIKDIARRREMMDDLKKEANDLQTIVDLTYLVSSTFSSHEILYFIVKKISEVISVTRCSIIRVNSDKRNAYVISTFEDPKLKNLKLDLRKYPEIRKALKSKEPVIVNDVSKDPLMEKVRGILFPLGIRSIVVIPIVFREEVIGTIFLRTSRAQSNFTEKEIRLCNAIADVTANALYNALLFERIEGEKAHLEKLAITDFLTEIFNVRYFYHRLAEEFSRSERYKLSLSCLMLDIDHFKEINDKHGHRVGDIVLREFAQVLKKRTRKSDVLARYGGEEFIMLLAQTSVGGALAKAEALRSIVKGHRFQGLKGKTGLTVSIGVATYPHAQIKNKDDLITHADNALFKAKDSGRNRVVLDKP